jgi:Protein of unknown function (DUF1343)/Beta-lactamase
MIRGDVHDPRAFRLDQVAGNAGLFSTASDLSRFARMLLNDGELDGVRVLPVGTYEQLASPHAAGGVARGLGWDVRTSVEAQRDGGMGARSIGHFGFTGTWMRIDRDSNRFAIVLSNDVHPRARGDVRRLAHEVERLVARAPFLPRPSHVVRSGIDVELESGRPHLQEPFVLLTHDAARTLDGRMTREVLARGELTALWAPEHGLETNREGALSDSSRQDTRVHSLFGARRTPTVEMLHGACTIVVDLCDVGVRFYTYAATLHRVLGFAATQPGLRVVVLDRPNPLGGTLVEGPTLTAGLETFVNHHTLPLRHGMTLGELARLLDSEEGYELGPRLVIVPVAGWQPEWTARDLGLRWVPPSPNLPDAETALLYPAVALVEGTSLSVGRGTAEPFHEIRGRWLRPADVLRALVPESGVTWRELEPNARGPGLGVALVEAEDYRASPVGVAMVSALLTAHGSELSDDDLVRMVGRQDALDALRSGNLRRAREIAEDDATRFRGRRAPYLLYPR